MTKMGGNTNKELMRIIVPLETYINPLSTVIA
jgi:hypothetical protein